jgi:hypothetical protein
MLWAYDRKALSWRKLLLVAKTGKDEITWCKGQLTL